jgi:hypothetical protein
MRERGEGEGGNETIFLPQRLDAGCGNAVQGWLRGAPHEQDITMLPHRVETLFCFLFLTEGVRRGVGQLTG